MGFMYRFVSRMPAWSALAAVPVGLMMSIRGVRTIYGYADDVAPPKTVTAKPYSIYNAGRVELSEFLRVVPYGVLGTQLTNDKEIVSKADPPSDLHTVIVDPAGLQYIQKTPAGAGGAAGAIYRWLGEDLLPQDQPFPEVVRQEITQTTHASRYVYGGRAVIHAVGPDLRGDTYRTGSPEERYFKAKRDLSCTYANILRQFAEHCEPEIMNWRHDELDHNERRPYATLRMLPVSGGIFAGAFKKDMPQLTVEAVVGAFQMLPKEYRRALAKRASGIELCVFDEAEYSPFRSATEQVKRNLHLSKTSFDDVIHVRTPWMLQHPDTYRVLRSDPADPPPQGK